MTSASRRRQSGQSLTEYILIVALVAVASIAIVTIFGDQIRNIFSASSVQLSGDTSGKVDLQGDPTGQVNKHLNNF